MEMTIVDSSLIRAIGYDENTNTLRLEFNKGRGYEYQNVPKEVYKGIMKASSAGRYFNAEIKGNYSYSEI